MIDVVDLPAIDTLITNAAVFTGNREVAHVPRGSIAIDDGIIIAVGPDTALAEKYAANLIVDASGALVHPGFIESHLHMPSPAFLEMPIDAYGRDPRMISYSALKSQSTDESTEALAAAAAVAMMRRGYTFFVEAGTVFETDAFAAGLEKCGMRGLVSVPFGWDNVSLFRDREPGYVSDFVLKRAPSDTKRVVDGLGKELLRNLDADALVRGYVCLYGEGTASDELTKEAIRLAKSNGVIFNQHQSFMTTWVDAELETFGKSGVKRLQENGALGEQTTLTHMNYLSNEEAELVASTKTNVIWCPNQSLPRGFHNENRCWHPWLCRQGVSVSIATDTALEYPLGSAGSASLLLSGMVGDPIARSDPFYMMTIDAARNIGVGAELGSIVVGKKADLVIRSANDVSHLATDTHGAIFSSSAPMIPVDKVFVGGRLVMDDGRLILSDHEEVLETATIQKQEMIRRARG